MKSYKFIVLSDDEEINLALSDEKHTPFTDCVCSYKDTKQTLSDISQILTYPSWDPDINLLKICDGFASALTPSEWPEKLCKKGFANIFYSLHALNALWNYLALENGCSARGVLTTVEVGSWVIVCILTIVGVCIINKLYYNDSHFI